LSVAKLLAHLKTQRVRLDRAIAALERIRDSRGDSVPQPKAGKRRSQRTARKRAASRRTKPATPASIIPFAPPASPQDIASK